MALHSGFGGERRKNQAFPKGGKAKEVLARTCGVELNRGLLELASAWW